MGGSPGSFRTLFVDGGLANAKAPAGAAKTAADSPLPQGSPGHMCGIIAIVGTAPVQERLIESLKRLEYRGYDSAGVAGVMDGKVARRRAAGKIRALEEVL